MGGMEDGGATSFLTLKKINIFYSGRAKRDQLKSRFRHQFIFWKGDPVSIP